MAEEERKKMGATKRFGESKAGKALKQIRKRQYDSTTNASAWSKINVELGAPVSVNAGQASPPVVEKPDAEATRAALRLMAESGNATAETLLKELAAAETATEEAKNKQDNRGTILYY